MRKQTAIYGCGVETDESIGACAFDLCAIEKVSLQGINGSRKATRGIRLCESGWSETDPINLLLLFALTLFLFYFKIFGERAANAR